MILINFLISINLFFLSEKELVSFIYIYLKWKNVLIKLVF